ncbi:MAG: aldo/keto reductase [Actinomycetota bacterium]|nr:aldo/keto reductase [Actinomycetota bacterium]
MIERMPFGRTGHESSRTVFGAAALAAMSEPRCETVFETLLEFGVNHIDTAASYGESELRLRPFLADHRAAVFLATKTGERGGDAARASLERSLERMGVESVDLIQLHNLVEEEDWEAAFASGGAVDALSRAREEGLVRFIGVTGHGTWAPAMHLRSLDRFSFDSVLAPYNFTMMAQPEYRDDFEQLATACSDRGVALQTIKSVSRGRWQGDTGPRFSWYEPLTDEAAIRRAVHWVLARPDVFLNTSSDGRLLRLTLEIASEAAELPSDDEMRGDVEAFDIEPLFVRDVSDAI